MLSLFKIYALRSKQTKCYGLYIPTAPRCFFLNVVGSLAVEPNVQDIKHGEEHKQEAIW